ncbi:hypothetical protein [Trinickia soli]|jgi:hypothetical protein|uniref:hypothetical protein n=1 Tax=Trinickia soli TaxID=380675 RepID=UPI00125112E7|nr:hypothetical protein CIW54_16415 [Paraburkholderia sp. T12-10]
MHYPDAAFTHRGYLLNCAPARAGDGSYQPYVVISRSSDGELVANRFFPSELRFADEAAAIAHARDWAVRWIDASSLTV